MSTPKTPNYKRQKMLLLMVKEAGGHLTRTDVQKLLFLTAQDQKEPYFDFVPYRFGSFSFQAATDLDTLNRLGWLALTNKDVQFNNSARLKTGLPVSEIAHVVDTMKKYRDFRGGKLVRYVYENYPYFAINSEIAEDILDEQEYASLQKQRHKLDRKKQVIFTIGYEGLKFETYINRLIQNSVRLLCDVRQNPHSRKYGFSKRTLERVLPKLGIQYAHIPELGIASAKRRGVNSAGAFEELFDEYRDELPTREAGLQILREIIQEHHRVALTCFEAHHRSCHRHCISDYLEQHENQTVEHL